MPQSLHLNYFNDSIKEQLVTSRLDKDSHQWPNACVKKGPSEEPGTLAASQLQMNPAKEPRVPPRFQLASPGRRRRFDVNGHWTNEATVPQKGHVVI